MLKTLHIENIAVIERADVEFSAGLSVLTGRNGRRQIDHHRLAQRCTRQPRQPRACPLRRGRASVTASFESAQAERWCADNEIDADDGEIILQRRISTDGKSTAV